MQNSTVSSSDALLNSIFEITQQLYAEMCKPHEDTSDDHNEIFRLLTDLGRSLANADRASFWKWDKRTHTLWTTAAVGTDRITVPEGTGLVGKALSEKRAIVTNDPYNDPDFNPEVDKKTGYVTKSILVMPVSDCKGEYIGVYQVINKLDNDGKFDLETDCRSLSLAAFICGITLESEIFLDDSQHDKLTGLKNRMGFYSDCYKLYSKSASSGTPVSMFICDIDFFKKVNDTYGHNAGDAVLKAVAGILGRNVPEGGGVYRWGGEEFIMIVPGTDKAGIAAHAEDIRKQVLNSVCTFEGTDIKVTMSFGCGSFDGLSIDESVKAADENLYAAKESGRNRVVV